ncbi:hypothetical protein C3L33_19990, partial [Rhododendron williamsianum]
MDRYQNVEKPRPEVPIHENEIRITSQGLVRNYISYATGLLQGLSIDTVTTWELAAQTEKTILTLGNFINMQAHACVGGRSVGEDIRRLESGVHDESDEMLSRGFKDQIYDVYRYLPPELQMSKSMTDPVRILVKRDELTLEGIKRSSLQ